MRLNRGPFSAKTKDEKTRNLFKSSKERQSFTFNTGTCSKDKAKSTVLWGTGRRFGRAHRQDGAPRSRRQTLAPGGRPPSTQTTGEHSALLVSQTPVVLSEGRREYPSTNEIQEGDCKIRVWVCAKEIVNSLRCLDLSGDIYGLTEAYEVEMLRGKFFYCPRSRICKCRIRLVIPFTYLVFLHET